MYIVHRGTKSTLFGYDVAMYRNGPEEYRLNLISWDCCIDYSKINGVDIEISDRKLTHTFNKYLLCALNPALTQET
uniref:Uncharacterized protein n=1 Tax=Romanomermis culicivorax TaxID=13658 RepID=A0A915HPV2_ROMCU